MYLSKDQKVEGIYMDGQKFTGKIINRRFVTTNNNVVEYFVKLDNNIKVFEHDHETLMLYVDYDGNSTYYTNFGKEQIKPIN